MDRNIVLITAKELKELAEEWASPKNKNREKPFNLALLSVSGRYNRDRLGKLKISDQGIRERDELITQNFFSKGIPLCGVLGGGYNKDFNKLVELHSFLHQSCAKLI